MVDLTIIFSLVTLLKYFNFVVDMDGRKTIFFWNLPTRCLRVHSRFGVITRTDVGVQSLPNLTRLVAFVRMLSRENQFL